MTEPDAHKPAERDTGPSDTGQPESPETAVAETAAAGTGDAETGDAEAAGSPPAGAGEVAASSVEPGPVVGPEAAVGSRTGRRGSVIGIAVGAVGILAAVVTVLAFAWPGFLAGPGSPDAVADRAVAALSAQDGAALDQVTCRSPDGTAVSQLPPQLLQAVTGVDRTGAVTLLLDTQAQAPVTVTLQAQGQSQEVPAVLLLGVTGGEWCFGGLSQSQTG